MNFSSDNFLFTGSNSFSNLASCSLIFLISASLFKSPVNIIYTDEFPATLKELCAGASKFAPQVNSSKLANFLMNNSFFSRVSNSSELEVDTTTFAGLAGEIPFSALIFLSEETTSFIYSKDFSILTSIRLLSATGYCCSMIVSPSTLIFCQISSVMNGING